MEKHTPGPWIIDEKNHVFAEQFYKAAPFTDLEGIEHPDFKEGLIALPYRCGDGSQEANAQLIAAAPELFSLLTEIVETFPEADPESECFDMGINGGDAVDFLCNFIPRAIKALRGEQP